MSKRSRLSKISLLHYYKLVFRSVLFLLVAIVYLYDRLHDTPGRILNGVAKRPVLMLMIWIIFVIEMILRFFPSKVESMGCQKQFARNYLPQKSPRPLPSDRASIMAVAAVWLLLNGIIGVLYLTEIIDWGILLLVSLAYSVCDMICILFFCPFQSWFMKNKCCGTCRIYNWDYAMMFTPLLFIPSWFTWSLSGLGIALLVNWEILRYCHPERFYEETNANLSCANCQEKLCSHKRQLRHLHQKLKARIPTLPITHPQSQEYHDLSHK